MLNAFKLEKLATQKAFQCQEKGIKDKSESYIKTI